MQSTPYPNMKQLETHRRELERKLELQRHVRTARTTRRRRGLLRRFLARGRTPATSP